MAGDFEGPNFQTWGALRPVPIAQLSPNLPEQSSCMVEGEVTIVWPYSLVTKSIAFKLVEPDFRLRRDKGQIRIEFHGPAGKSVSDALIGGGDTVWLGLEGARWEKASPDLAARSDTVEWQAKFTHRLHLKLRRGETSEEVAVNVDVPESDDEPAIEIPRDITPPVVDGLDGLDGPSTPCAADSNGAPALSSAITSLPAKRLASTTFESDEYASPAFLKRARVSYGSLFEGGLDMLDEERTGSSRRKRARFSMNSNWRYTSRTPSPEPSSASSPEPIEDEDAQPDQAQGLNHTADTQQQQPTTNQTDTVESTTFTQPPPKSPKTIPSTNHDRHVDASPLPNALVADNAPAKLEDSFRTEQEKASADNTSYHPYTEFHPPVMAVESANDFIGDFSHPHDLSTHLSSHALVAPDLPPAATSTATPLDAPREEFSFEDSGYHVLAANDNQDGDFTTLHGEPHGVFPPVSSHNISDTHLPEPFASFEANQAEWTGVSQVSAYPPPPAHNSIHHTVEIIDSSSPPRPPSPDVEEDFEEQQHSDASGEQDVNERRSREDKEDRALDADRADYQVDEDESQEGSDVSGEDYDLRNYDVAKADDVVEPEEAPVPSPGDPDEQVADLNPKSDEEEEDVSGSEREEYLDEDAEEEAYSSGGENQDLEEDAENFEEDQEAGSYDEDGYEEEYEEEEDEWEEEKRLSKPTASQDPVFISLLSDSEDETEPPPATQQPQEKPKQEVVPANEEEAKSDIEMAQQASFDGHEDEEEEEDEYEDEYEDEEDDVDEDGDEQMQDANAHDTSLVNQLDDAEDTSPAETRIIQEGIEQSVVPEDDIHQSTGKVSLPAAVDEAPQSTETDHIKSVDLVGEKETDAAPESSLLDTSQHEANKDLEHEKEHIAATRENESTRNVQAVTERTNENAEKLASTMEDSSKVSSAPQVSGSSSTQDVDVVIGRNENSAAPKHPQAGSLQLAAAGIDDNQTAAKSATQDYQTEHEITDIPSRTTLQNAPEDFVEESQPQTTESLAKEAKLADEDISTRDFSKETSKPESATTRPKSPTLTKPTIEPSHPISEKAATPVVDESAGHHHSPGGSGPSLVEPLPSSPRMEQDMDISRDQSVPDVKKRKTEKLGHGATTSPPPTQPVLVVDVPSHGMVPSAGAEQLPTPNEVVREPEAEAPASARDSVSEDDYSFAAEQQIMAESQEYESTQARHDTEMPDSDHTKDDTSSVLPTQASPQHDKKAKGKPERDILITVQSLRSWDHRRKSTSSDAPSDQPQDPSVSLARAPASSAVSASHEDGKPHLTLHVTRSMAHRSDDPSLDLARAPGTPTTTKSTQRYTTPDRSLETPALSQSLRSKTPDSPADVLNTPSVVGSSAGDEHASMLKRKLTQELRDHLPDYLPLKSIRSYLSRTTDVMGVVTATPPQATRPKNGPRDYMLEVMLTDPSAAPSSVVVAQFFRPHQTSLPVVQPGDVVILRRFQIISLRKRGVGIRTGDDSSWAVIEKGDEEMLPQIKGPPVELADAELTHAEGLRRWWGLLDVKARDKLDKATDKMVQAGKPDGK